MTAKTVLFGGTFDPIHNAHIEIARAAMDRFAFDQVLFIPAANPPHKFQKPQAVYEDRVRMAELACAGDSAFRVSRIEHGAARSYSILTIEKLEEAGAGALGFLIGADAFAEIQSWHRWQDVVRKVEFIVVGRPGAAYAFPPGASAYELTGIDMAISSSAIRARLADGDFDVPVPASVLDYIQARGLYRSQNLKKSSTPLHPVA